MMLSTSQLSKFTHQGYLVLEDVINVELLNAVKDEYAHRIQKLYKHWYKQGWVVAPKIGMSSSEMLDSCQNKGFDWYQPLDISLPHEDIREDTPMYFGPAIFNIITSDVLLNIVESYLGSEITSNPIQHIRIKPPQQRVADNEARAHIIKTDWHQDRGVGSPEADQTNIITVWVAITDASEQKGCLRVIPNKHQVMLPHCPKQQTAIADGQLCLADAVSLPVRAGGVVLLHPLTPHSSLPNKSKEYRWSFDLRYNVSGQATGRSQFPEFVARSKQYPEHELRDWKIWKKLWQVARRDVANRPHISQHRWQADSPACA